MVPTRTPEGLLKDDRADAPLHEADGVFDPRVTGTAGQAGPATRAATVPM